MPFGKYRGLSVADIIEEDPQYLEWLCRNTDFELNHILMDELETSYEDAARNAKLYAD